MKRLIWEARMALFVWLLELSINLIPKSAQKTWQWLALMPRDEFTRYYQGDGK